MPTSTLTFLLTERRRFSGHKLDSFVAKVLGQADKLPDLNAGEQAQLERHVSILPRRWPMAALTRQFDANDAEHYSWLRADPAHVRAEMGVVRLLACGELGLTQSEADELLKPLKILFGDVGFPLSAPHPSRWYLMLPKESKLPDFKSPDEAIGADIFSLLPTDDTAKRWRALLNEAQITLHNHPLNAERIQKGLLPVNSLYFWGSGVLPDQVKFHPQNIKTDDVNIKSLMLHAGLKQQDKSDGATLVDCRSIRDWSLFEREHLLPTINQLKQGKQAELVLDFADGASFSLKPSQKWRFWRAALNDLA
ncbi:MAG: phosphoglycerate mutase [Arenimonas sp.]